MTDALAQFGLAEGSVHLRSYSLDPSETVELDTPNVAVTLLQAGDVRVDVDPDSGTTTVLVDSGQVQVDGNGLQQVMEAGQRMQLAGSNPVAARWLGGASTDGLDRFSMDRDVTYDSATAADAQYVNSDTIGAEDLSANGDWETDSEEGPVWYPTGVAADWQPYSCGRWAWVAPWGWTWVDCAPWGFAPFHYGRWQHRGGRWGWIPGPPVVRPVYSPALVVFVGGDRLNPGGGPVTAWFPLGPHEAYVPWYHASGRYVNRVNVSNIYDRNTAQVRKIYNDRTGASAYAAGGDRRYVNRPTGTIAVSQAGFAAGKRVGPSMVHVNPEVLAAAPVLPHPLVTPERTMVVSAPARAVPLREARPTLESTRGDARVRSTAQPEVQPVYQKQAAPIARQPGYQHQTAPIETRTEGQPTGQPAQPSYQHQTAPAQVRPESQPLAQPVQPGYQHQTAPMQVRPESQPMAQPVQPGYQHQTAPMQVRPESQPMAQPVPHPVQPGYQHQTAPAQVPLYNRAVPPSPRPSFDQQQKAIQSVDPGRPLGPEQLNRLRENQPAGQPQQREIPHPAPAPRTAPAPRPSPGPRGAPPAVVKH